MLTIFERQQASIRLPKKAKINMTVIEYTNETISFSDLANKVLKHDDMVTFKMKDCKITGGERDMITCSKAFRGHPKMKEFSLSNVTVVDAETDLDQVISTILVTCEELKTLGLEKVKVSPSALSTIGFCGSVKTLLMPNSDLKDEDVSAVATALAASQSLTVVDLSGNDFSDTGCLAISKALEKNVSLTELKLDGNGKISGDSRNKIELTLRERAGGVPQAA